MKRFTLLIILSAGFSPVSLAAQVYTDSECLLEVKNRVPVCQCNFGQSCQPHNFEPPLTVAWFDEDAGSGKVTPACMTTYNWNFGGEKLDKVYFYKRCLVNFWKWPIVDQNGKTQCCLGGYGGDEKLPNPYYSQSSSIPGASDSSLTLDDVAPFAE